MIKQILIFISIFILLHLNANAKEIPDSLMNFIKSELPDLSIPSKTDYIHGWKGFISEKELPYYCTSDYNGDQKLDHALILINSKRQLFLYVFFETDRGYKATLVDKFNPQTNGVQTVIRVEEKGEWESITDKIQVPNDGISIDLIEESLSWSYYYDGKIFRRFLYD